MAKSLKSNVNDIRVSLRVVDIVGCRSCLNKFFFTMIREQSPASIVCEPRHVSWFSDEPNSLLESCSISRVAADPAVVPSAAVPGGSLSLIYYRWHGSPRMYCSGYDDAQLATLAKNLESSRDAGHECWTIFDNTAAGAAVENALTLQRYFPDRRNF